MLLGRGGEQENRERRRRLIARHASLGTWIESKDCTFVVCHFNTTAIRIVFPLSGFIVLHQTSIVSLHLLQGTVRTG